MRWVLVDDDSAYADYADRVLPWLRRDPVLRNVCATVLGSLVDGTAPIADPPLLAWLDDGTGTVTGAALCTPPRGLLLPDLPVAAVDALVEMLAAAGSAELPGVVGPADAADRFAAGFAARTGRRAELAMDEHLYELGTLVPPAGVPGRARVASADEAELLAAWLTGFSADAGLRPGPDPAAAAQRLLAQRRVTLWAVDDEPVCLVGQARPVAGVVRVGPVYTPPEHRRRGYAGACTAAVSAGLTAGGHRCILYTDRANRTSNGVYRRIGYRPVADTRDWAFR